MTHYLKKLESVVREQWDKKALCNFGGESFTYADLARIIAKFHIFFKDAGIVKGDKIGLCARNSAQWAVSFLAVNTYEAVAVPMLADFLPESICNLTNHSGSKALFTDPDIWEKLDIKAMPDVRFVANVKDFSLLYCKEDVIREAFDNLASSFDRVYPMGFSRENVRYPDGNGKDLAIINYTSGTTSAPKGVMLRYECMSDTVEFSQKRIPSSSSDNIVSMLPLAHMYGLAIEFIYPCCSGETIYFLGKTPSPTLLLKAMDEVKPSMVVAVPLVMEKIYKSAIKPVISKTSMKILLHTPIISSILYAKIRKKLLDKFGGKVKNFIMGGAPLNPEVEKCFKKIGIPYTVGYGMTEACPLLTYEDWFNYIPGSCGKAVHEIRIDSEDPQHIAGEIQARGTNICSGYFNNPEANSILFTEDGWLRTGDLGIIDSEGNLFIKGRSKNMILSANGQNIYPEEVEAVVNNQPYIGESVVVDRNGKLVALIYIDKDAIKRDKLDNERISDIPENARINANRSLPSYSQLTKMEVMTVPFEKTPKLSIKRFLYK